MKWSASEAERKLIEFISTELVQDSSDLDLRADSDLLASGLIDSLGVMRLIRFIEEENALSIPPADLTIENFMTVGTIVAYLPSLDA